jgi:hypothetical protein
MSATTLFDVKEKRNRHMKRSSWRKVVLAGVAGAVALLALGDHARTQVPPGGQDPLEILNLQVRANAIILLDSSGSMRELPDADYSGGVTSPSLDNGELAGDDPRSKMAQAKQVLRQVIQANETKVSFQFGRYTQAAGSYGPETPNGDAQAPFLYTKTCDVADVNCNADANAIVISNTAGGGCADAGCNIFLHRNAGFHRFTSGNTNIYHLMAGRFYNGQRFEVRQNGSAGVQISDVGDFNPPWVEVQTRANAAPNGLIRNPVRFTWAGVRWSRGTTDSSASCGGFDNLVGLSNCADNIQLDQIGPHLDPEFQLNASGNPIDPNCGVQPYGATCYTPVQGIRSAGFTPIAESLIDLKGVFTNLWNVGAMPATPAISTLNPKPRTFVVVLTDGDDSCTPAPDISAAGANDRALRAAHKAQQLYARINAVEPASSVTTFVVAFGTGLAADRSNWIAWGGSGMTGIPTTGSGNAQRWSRAPTAAERAACTTCVDAFIAADVNALIAALQAAIEQGQGQGEFSDQQSITESVFELSALAPPPPPPSPPASPAPSPNPQEPLTRYSARIPVLLQSTFTLPGFDGHLKAFNNVGGSPNALWDAGQELKDRVAAGAWTGRTFAQLCGSGPVVPFAATPGCAPHLTVATSAANIKRRIYTTLRNGTFTASESVFNLTQPNFVPTGQVALWPPDPTIDTARGTAGPLDAAMGLGLVGLAPAAQDALVLRLRADLGACTADASGAARPAVCPAPAKTSAFTATEVTAVVKEARQIILAHAAGAALTRNGVNAVRLATSATCPAPGGCLQFDPRAWVMAESTLAASAVVTPPPQSPPQAHNAEYELLRDGPRTAGDIATDGMAHGFGLRNPDDDANAPPPGIPDTRTNLKPVMSVVYHGSNHMVHAFRAGPCPGACIGTSVPAGGEAGGEELWAFVPYDQLSKLAERVKVQVRNPHTYVVATPIRVVDVFVPGNFTRSVGGVTVSGSGVWRTVILFGRGIAGKYYTAIDITAPGRFNQTSLSTAPPIVMWSRGNPDTQSGSPTGTDYNNSAADFTAYSGMGQTWSVPAISFVTAAAHKTPRRPNGTEFVAFTGSGYGSPSEGSTVYTLDMLTGDVIRSFDIGDRPGVSYENSLVASASAFNPQQLIPGVLKNAAESKSTRVYIPDVHGRIWRLMVETSDPPANTPPLMFADAGADQPFGNPVALVNYEGTAAVRKPHVFAESGNDNRIFPPPTATPPFKMYGLRDDDLITDPNASDDVDGPAFRLFSIPFPDGFRGTVQPATAFADPTPLDPTSGDEVARVFFAGTRFNPLNSPNAPPPPPCRSSFDSILFAVAAESGGAAYDLNATGDDRSIQLNQQRIQAVRAHGGRLVVDTGLSAQNAPPPPAPPIANPGTEDPTPNVLVGGPLNPDGTQRIPGLVTFKINSSVCR